MAQSSVICSRRLLSEPFCNVILDQVEDLVNITKCRGGVIVIGHQSMAVALTIWSNLVNYKAVTLTVVAESARPAQAGSDSNANLDWRNMGFLHWTI
jgi:hypothetical protein